LGEEKLVHTKDTKCTQRARREIFKKEPSANYANVNVWKKHLKVGGKPWWLLRKV